MRQDDTTESAQDYQMRVGKQIRDRGAREEAMQQAQQQNGTRTENSPKSKTNLAGSASSLPDPS